MQNIRQPEVVLYFGVKNFIFSYLLSSLFLHETLQRQQFCFLLQCFMQYVVDFIDINEYIHTICTLVQTYISLASRIDRGQSTIKLHVQVALTSTSFWIRKYYFSRFREIINV